MIRIKKMMILMNYYNTLALAMHHDVNIMADQDECGCGAFFIQVSILITPKGLAMQTKLLRSPSSNGEMMQGQNSI